ncbi:MAG: ABC transporter ATP-binding protein [Salinivenus sp.]
MALLRVREVGVRLGGEEILSDVAFDIEAGTWIGLIGPNGSGKTTLLRAIGTHVPFDGEIALEGRSVTEWTAAERARRMAFVRQAASLSFDFTVKDLVLLGRSPHRGWLQAYQGSDRSRVQEALAQVDLEGFESRSVLSLSGGETQRVFLAQALVQEADLLLLDEPTAHLDVHYQFTFMEQVSDLVDAGHTVLAVFHDLELAARYTDRLLVLQDGRLRANGPPADVLTPERIADIFGMRARVHRGTDDTLRIEYLDPVPDASSTAPPHDPRPTRTR